MLPDIRPQGDAETGPIPQVLKNALEDVVRGGEARQKAKENDLRKLFGLEVGGKLFVASPGGLLRDWHAVLACRKNRGQRHFDRKLLAK